MSDCCAKNVVRKWRFAVLHFYEYGESVGHSAPESGEVGSKKDAC